MNTMKGMLIILGMKSMDIRMDAGRVQCIRTARSLPSMWTIFSCKIHV